MEYRYNIGDTVRVLPYKQLKMTLADGCHADDGLFFNRDMIKYCGRTFVIERLTSPAHYCLIGAEGWTFHQDWLEEDTPPEDVTVTMSFEDMMDAMHD